MEHIDIKKAINFATDKFNEIGKKNHFLDVFQILKDELGIKDDNILIASLLHDTIEDTNTTYEEIASHFSTEVADLVQEVSHPKNYDDKQRAEYYEKIKTISENGKLIKIADFISHIRNFTKIYERHEQHLFPKFINNYKYVANIEGFLVCCTDSVGKNLLSELLKQFKKYL